MAKILVIEDESNLRFAIRQSLARMGHELQDTGSVSEARDLAAAHDPELVICDVNLGVETTGIDLLRQMRDGGFDGAFVVITAYGTVEKAVEAMKLGADDYIQKPMSLQELAIVVARALENRQLRARLKLYERIERTREESEELLGSSSAWRSAVTMAEKLAAMPLPAGRSGAAGVTLPTILLLGETGTGKGLMARHIHRCAAEGPGPSANPASGAAAAAKPFIHVNCASIPASLIESELFGHEKGAFTDAKAARTGLFEMADGGTIFLDEIGDMPADLQSKILLVLEHGVFRRVGGGRERSVSARVIAATNQPLEQWVEAGLFRRDLLYRLNAFTLRLPPLRERGEDAEQLAKSFLERLRQEHRRAGLSYSPVALAAIRHHGWPGNVRELSNAVQRAVLLAPGPEIGPADLGLNPLARKRAPEAGDERAAPAEGTAESKLVFDFEHQHYTASEVERELVVQALRRVRGNVSKAAKLIGMNRSSLRYRIERLGLEGEVQEMARQ